MKQVKISLEFGSVLLPVATNEARQEVVPLKPIVEEIGLEWARQHKKMQTPYYIRRLGVCIVQMYYAGQAREMVCIRLDRVAAYLNTISPEQVRGTGNEAAADYLERKHTEWDDLIHQYEAQNGQLIQQVTTAKIVSIRTFLAIGREKRQTKDEADRNIMSAMQRGLAADVGVPYQEELTA